MSKLSEMIQAAQTNERCHVFTPLIDIRSEVKPTPPCVYPEHYIYELTAKFGCNATVRFGDNGELDQKLRMIRRQVVEAIFGEFRENIHEIQRALADYDCATATSAVSDLYDRMFDA